MPAFVFDPNNPGAYVNTANNTLNIPAPASSPAGGSGGSATTGSAPAAASSSGVSAAERRRRARERRRQRQEERRAAAERRRNPLYAPFKTPAQLRAEAARLAALSAPSETTLRAEQQREQAGLEGATTALTGQLSNILGETQAGLRSFGDLYARLGAQATGAGKEALAAAGSPTDIAATVSPQVASQLAGLAAPMLGYPGAAAATGARLVGQSRAGLTRALTDRANRISENTAKYLQSLQDTEYQKAIARETAAQNAARLSLSQQGAEFDQQMDLANLGLRQQTVEQGWARIAQSATNAANRAGQDTPKRIRAIKRDFIKNRRTILTGGGGGFVATYVDGNSRAIEVPIANATTMDEARRLAPSLIPEAFRDDVTIIPGSAPLSRDEIISDLVDQLVFEGMSRKNARAWVLKNIMGSSA